MSISFGMLTAVDALDLYVEEGEIVSLDRSERRRQDNGLQRDHGRIQARLRLDQPGRREHRGPAAAPDCDDGRREDVPVDPPLPEHVRTGERDGGRLRTNHRSSVAVDLPNADGASGGARGARACRGPAVVLRRAARRLSVRPACVQPLVRQSQTPRDRPCDGGETENPPPRRAGRGHESEGDPGDHCAHVASPRREGIHRARDRARHARRRRRVRTASWPSTTERRSRKGRSIMSQRTPRWSRRTSARARR